MRKLFKGISLTWRDNTVLALVGGFVTEDYLKEKITELGIIQSSMQVDAPVTKEETVYTDDEEDVVTQAIIGGADAPSEIYLDSTVESE